MTLTENLIRFTKNVWQAVPKVAAGNSDFAENLKGFVGCSLIIVIRGFQQGFQPDAK